MPVLYLDIFSGISGDMMIGALIDLGVPFSRLESELQRLGVGGYHLHTSHGEKSGIAGIKFDVHLDDEHHHGHGHGQGHDHGHSHSHAHAHGHAHPPSPGHRHDHDHDHSHGRNYADIRRLLERSPLDPWVKSKALAVFHRIAVAEGKIHGRSPDDVHFHEVGAIDSIVDIVGTCLALDILGRPRVLAGPVVEGTGFVKCAHGRMPLPAPATLEILAARGIPMTQCDEPAELVTPTGAALLAEFAEKFGPLQGLSAQRVGYGLGTRNNKTRPNVLRAVLGDIAVQSGPQAHDWEIDEITVLETNLDDISPEILGHVVEKAFAAGALDVFHSPVQMKKNRPGVIVTVLAPAALADPLTELLLVETGAFGVRQTTASRRKLRREFNPVITAFGEVSVKLGILDGRIVHRTPEFESCRALAVRANVPLKEVYEATVAAAAALTLGPSSTPKP
ncbi:MAG: nickel pincer cofactor biosynthesis protein LarC [Verrucomicrobiales bacterium]|nr:nickel pincer cofactor biosynthesis protein LarC [Verrucomicrobiales bacterium]